MPSDADTLISPFAAGLACRCPRCGEGQLFSGFLEMAPKCESCGLDFAFGQSGDGPAFFVIFAVSPIIVLLAFITEALFHPAPWMHLVLWIPTIVILSLLLLRPFKEVLVALQYHRQAGESPMQKNQHSPAIRKSPTMARRYEVVNEGSSWTVGTGGQSLRGYSSSKAAIDAAIDAAHGAEKAGEHITIYLWDQGTESQVYVTPNDRNF